MVVMLTEPPDSTISVPPDRTVTLALCWPALIVSVTPLETTVSLITPSRSREP